MTNRKKEIAKFICGVEAFHACIHTYFWLSGTRLNVFGVKENPNWHLAAAAGNAAAAIILGVYAWGDVVSDSPERSTKGEIT